MSVKPNGGNAMHYGRGEAGMGTRHARAERRRDSLRRFMEARNITASDWARRAGLVSANAIYNFLNSRSDSLSLHTLEALAAAEGVEPTELTGDALVATAQRGSVRLRVVGAVQAGVWVGAMRQPRDEHVTITLTASKLSDPAVTFGLIMRGNSMNRRYQPGTILECCPWAAYDRPVRDGDALIMIRRNHAGLVEIACKELQQAQDGRAWLWPRSDDPAHQQPTPVAWPPARETGLTSDGVEDISIHAVVVRSIRDEIAA